MEVNCEISQNPHTRSRVLPKLKSVLKHTRTCENFKLVVSDIRQREIDMCNWHYFSPKPRHDAFAFLVACVLRLDVAVVELRASVLCDTHESCQVPQRVRGAQRERVASTKSAGQIRTFSDAGLPRLDHSSLDEFARLRGYVPLCRSAVCVCPCLCLRVSLCNFVFREVSTGLTKLIFTTSSRPPAS